MNLELRKYDLTLFDKVVADIEKIKEEGNFIPECSNKKGYEASKRFVLDITRPARKNLEDAHKDTKKPFWDTCKLLDEKKRQLLDSIEEVETPHKQAYRFVDQEEMRLKKERNETIQKHIDRLDEMVGEAFDANADSKKITALLEECKYYRIDRDFLDHRTKEVELNHQYVLKKITDRLAQQFEFERMAKENAIAKEKEEERLKVEKVRLEKEQKEERKKEWLQLEKQMEIDKEENQKKHDREIERLKIAEEERRKLDAEAEKERAREAKEMVALQLKQAQENARVAERMRQEDKKLVAIAEKKQREANKQHVANIRRKAKEALMAIGLNEEMAKKVILLIDKQQIPNVSINY